jgi:hypothetical protein
MQRVHHHCQNRGPEQDFDEGQNDPTADLDQEPDHRDFECCFERGRVRRDVLWRVSIHDFCLLAQNGSITLDLNQSLLPGNGAT